MTSQSLLISRAGDTDAAVPGAAVPPGVVVLTLHRPERLNSLDRDLKTALRDALTGLGDDPACRAVVLTGAGRAFCVGQDLREHVTALAERPDDALATVREHYNPLMERLAMLPKPVVAAVRGTAAGAGVSLALLADFRVGGPGTKFVTAFAGIGLAADSGMSWTLPRLVGHGKATELLMLGETVDAAEAHRLGLLTRLADTDDDVLPAATALAGQLAAGPTVAYAQIKRELVTGGSGNLHDALAAEADAQATCGRTTDHAGAIEAFLAKTRPTFEGK